MPKVPSESQSKRFSISDFLRHREIGKKSTLGFGDTFNKGIYTSLQPYSTWDQQTDDEGTLHGGVFNLEFSPDG